MKEIFARRSVRTFTPEPVSAELVERLLRAAMQAPSACNCQPWAFVVVRSRETMQRMMEISPYAKPLATADCAVVVCGDTKLECAPGFWVEDCSAATQNLLLEAEHLGLGGVWMGLHPMHERAQAVQALLGLPETVIPLGIIALGHPASHPDPADRYLPERVHFERWNG